MIGCKNPEIGIKLNNMRKDKEYNMVGSPTPRAGTALTQHVLDGPAGAVWSTWIGEEEGYEVV